MMTEFDIKLADEVLTVGCRHRLTAAFLDPFRVGSFRKDTGSAEALTASDDDIERIQADSNFILTLQNDNARHAEWYLETTALHEKISRALIPRGVLLVHGSAVVAGGNAYLFIAPTRTGKSTHTHLWLQLPGVDAYIVNDDKQLMRPTAEGVLTYASPWGMVDKPTPDHAPVAAIVLLRRGETDVIRPSNTKEMLPALMKASPRGRDARETAAILDLQLKILSGVKLYTMQCTPTLEAARTAYEALTKGQA